MNCITDEAIRRATDGLTRPGWPLRVNAWRDSDGSREAGETPESGSTRSATARPAGIAQTNGSGT